VNIIPDIEVPEPFTYQLSIPEMSVRSQKIVKLILVYDSLQVVDEEPWNILRKGRILGSQNIFYIKKLH
jgi:hypothetical protein